MSFEEAVSYALKEAAEANPLVAGLWRTPPLVATGQKGVTDLCPQPLEASGYSPWWLGSTTQHPAFNPRSEESNVVRPAFVLGVFGSVTGARDPSTG